MQGLAKGRSVAEAVEVITLSSESEDDTEFGAAQPAYMSDVQTKRIQAAQISTGGALVPDL